MRNKLILIRNYIFIFLISLSLSMTLTVYISDENIKDKLDHEYTFNVKNEEVKNSFLKSLFFNNLLSYFIFANCLFIFTFYVKSVNNIDLSWGAMIFYSLIYNFFCLKYVYQLKTFSLIDLIEKHSYITIFTLLPPILFGFKHIFFVLRTFRGFEKDFVDFRYREYSIYNQDKFLLLKNWISIYFNFHFINCLIVGLICFPALESLIIVNISVNNLKNSYYSVLGILFLISLFAIIFETIADQQLYRFRINKTCIKNKEKLKIINHGLWKFSRHPNYFGEILYYWTLIIMNYIINSTFKIQNLIGGLVMTFIFLSFSIPVMEDHMLKKHEKDYREYIKNTSAKLIPYIF